MHQYYSPTASKRKPYCCGPFSNACKTSFCSSSEEQALLRVLRDANTLATGSEGQAFEKEFAQFIGSADAVALNSCSSALELAAELPAAKRAMKSSCPRIPSLPRRFPLPAAA